MNSKKQEQRARIAYIVIVSAVILGLELIFMRAIVGNDLLLGDSGDGRLNNLLAEHWYKVLCGRESVTEVNIFYPIKNTLSYTDMVLGFAIPYCVLRLIGVNMFLANKLSLMGIHIMGSFVLFYFMKKKLKVNTFGSMAAVIVGSMSTSYAVASGHTQLFAISFLPIIVLCLFNFFENVNDNKKKRKKWLLLAIAVYALLMYTSFYIAFYFALFVIIALLVYLRVACLQNVRVFHNTWEFIKKNIKELILYCVFAVVLVLPFFAMYLPTSKLFGKRTWEEITWQLPNKLDIINVSEDSLIYGKWLTKYHLNDRPYAGELRSGIAAVTLLLFLAAVVFLYIRLKKNKQEEKERMITTVLFSTGLGVVVSLLLLVKVHDMSLWYLVYKLIPGGSAVRAAVRYLTFLTLPLGIVLGKVVGDISDEAGKKRKGFLLIGAFICLVLFTDNFMKTGVYAHWTIEDGQKVTADVAEPPQDCEIMFLMDSQADTTRTDHHNYQLDAWQIADYYNLKCLNGYSGQFPQDWSGLWTVNSGEYLEKVQEWVNNYDLEHVYGYDRATNEWVAVN